MTEVEEYRKNRPPRDTYKIYQSLKETNRKGAQAYWEKRKVRQRIERAAKRRS